MSAAHTPGPWTVTVDTRRSSHMPQVSRLGNDGTPYVIASVCGGIGKGAREANARLIAAAPDLLAALQRAHWALDMLTGCTLLHGESDGQKLHFKMVCDEADKARAALAKATGATP